MSVLAENAAEPIAAAYAAAGDPSGPVTGVGEEDGGRARPRPCGGRRARRNWFDRPPGPARMTVAKRSHTGRASARGRKKSAPPSPSSVTVTAPRFRPPAGSARPWRGPSRPAPAARREGAGSPGPGTRGTWTSSPSGSAENGSTGGGSSPPTADTPDAQALLGPADWLRQAARATARPPLTRVGAFATPGWRVHPGDGDGRSAASWPATRGGPSAGVAPDGASVTGEARHQPGGRTVPITRVTVISMTTRSGLGRGGR